MFSASSNLCNLLTAKCYSERLEVSLDPTCKDGDYNFLNESAMFLSNSRYTDNVEFLFHA